MRTDIITISLGLRAPATLHSLTVFVWVYRLWYLIQFADMFVQWHPNIHHVGIFSP
jgi:hypothetical protein